MKNQVVTISFFRYRGLSDCWFGFRQMGLVPQQLLDVPGLSFCKMLGSGSGNGFSVWPDFSTYALLGVWQVEKDALLFFDTHSVFSAFRQKASEQLTLFMKTAKSHGQWDQEQPFPVTTEYQPNQLVGVLTRATIHKKHLWKFWRYVPPVSRSMGLHQQGLLFAKGIGELPLIQQATFSLWQNSHAMQAYAYQSHHHKKVVRKTREIGWYSEELFARFHPYAYRGYLSNLEIFHLLTEV